MASEPPPSAPPHPAPAAPAAPAAPPAPAPAAPTDGGDGGHVHAPSARPLALALGALGVVYGDIGTSPLYAFRESIHAAHGVAPTPENILGVLSLIFWSLFMIVSVKYIVFILRADNRGEGGILALLALAPARRRSSGPGRPELAAWLGVAGAALLYGDGLITPAISVLSAVEGIEVATTALRPLVVPLTIAILVALFAVQRHGTGRLGRWFGPVMATWFVTIGVLGLAHVCLRPSVLAGLSPAWAVRLFQEHGWHAFRLLGSVVLAVTGAEALYADLGHFGRGPIRRAWFGLVLPALVLSYFGQGALVLRDPSAASSPFFAMAPNLVVAYLLVLLATAATVLASQALISGAFSLTRQAVQLGYFPRVTVAHTSSDTEGQIYIPQINWMLLAGCVALVLQFRHSSELAAAYGIAVSATMAITSLLYYLVARETWGWPLRRALPLLLLFLAFDLPFLAANLLKVADGGWVPLVIGGAFFTAMIIWRIGRDRLTEFYAGVSQPWTEFIARMAGEQVARTPGTSVWLTSSAKGAPPFLVHHVERSRALSERLLVVTIQFRPQPTVADAERVGFRSLGSGIHQITASYGFQEAPKVPALLRHPEVATRLGPIRPGDVTYYLGRETLVGGHGGRMGPLAERCFGFLSRNQKNATAYFSLPPAQVVEIGTHIDL